MISIPSKLRKVLFIIIALLCLTSLLSAPIALLSGFIFTLLFGNPFPTESGKIVKWLLKLSVIGLGFGMFLQKTLETGKEGLTLTVLSISVTLILGFIIGKLFHLDKKIAYLVSSGTAICGGSAIAAVSSVIQAKEKQISIALGVVFFLNSVAIFVFPPIGHWLDLSQHDFGLWSAIAIHDTSSVVGAAMAYGQEALDMAITVKLARALWIIPVSLLSMLFFKSQNGKFKIPWFIFIFVGVIIVNSYFDLPLFFTESIPRFSKLSLILTLFLVGSGLSIESIKESGFKPISLGLILWVVISVMSLSFILYL